MGETIGAFLRGSVLLAIFGGIIWLAVSYPVIFAILMLIALAIILGKVKWIKKGDL